MFLTLFNNDDRLTSFVVNTEPQFWIFKSYHPNVQQQGRCIEGDEYRCGACDDADLQQGLHEEGREGSLDDVHEAISEEYGYHYLEQASELEAFDN